jgi:hypothetical protein
MPVPALKILRRLCGVRRAAASQDWPQRKIRLKNGLHLDKKGLSPHFHTPKIRVSPLFGLCGQANN